MEEKLIDIWITPGYFRLQEWEDIVKLAHEHDMPVWAATDESRVKNRENKNSIEAYRARIMNMRRAGVDAVWAFNYFHFPPSREFELLKEAGAIETLAFLDKLYVPDDLGPKYAGFYLKDGLSHVRRQKLFAPDVPETLKPGQLRNIELRVGDDVATAMAQGYDTMISLRVQGGGMADDLQAGLNEVALRRDSSKGEWVEFAVAPSSLKVGVNGVALRHGGSAAVDITLKDIQLSIKYRRKVP
jgi:hypothetical protein